MADADTNGARITFSWNINHILRSSTRLEISLDRGTRSKSRLIKVSSVRRSLHKFTVFRNMRLILFVDFNAHFGPHMQIIVNLVLSQRLVDFWALLIDFTVIDVLSLILGR